MLTSFWYSRESSQPRAMSGLSQWPCGRSSPSPDTNPSANWQTSKSSKTSAISTTATSTTGPYHSPLTAQERSTTWCESAGRGTRRTDRTSARSTCSSRERTSATHPSSDHQPTTSEDLRMWPILNVQTSSKVRPRVLMHRYRSALHNKWY